MEKEYIDIMIQSLEKKSRLLDQIIKLNQVQKQLLEDPNLDVDDFEKNVSDKGMLVEQLELLDQGFEQLYEKVKEQLLHNRSQYSKQIERMQELIKMLTEKSTTVQAQEQRNYQQAQLKFSSIRKQVKNVRDSQKAVRQYYSNMMKRAENQPQFIDNKK